MLIRLTTVKEKNPVLVRPEDIREVCVIEGVTTVYFDNEDEPLAVSETVEGVQAKVNRWD